ncbi:P-loop containing nucleoside triphosphate hydrolase protein [Setomelanomma holmii]|uniref:RNA helicase n=1 Tax=Setomelanomma holmii TaxID=210430 RepID=A0A9P4LMJ1_9PLEO|nr:P-loop containing nucleoside triphosphate hydrolase protein [Setomelanomma holmii]
MPPLSARRNSLCFFCAFAARSRPQAQRLRPHTQTANRSALARLSDHKPDYRPRQGGVFNPLKPNPTTSWRGPRDRDSLFTSVRSQLEKLKDEFKKPEFLESLQLTTEELDKEWLTFERSINLWMKQAPPELKDLANEAARGKATLITRLRYLFYAQTCGGRFTTAELENQKEVADLRYPAEWYPATRQIPRTVHLHVGPTNSGKTYHALKRLEEAETGIYLGPLRLLAHEVYTRLNAKGKTCALVTGEEQRMPDGEKAKMFSCTVEMAPLNARFEVAVIDEIQMINHRERGWAWTQAFMGLQANEIHLCGEARTVPLMRELCALVGDEVHIHEYERLTPLQVESKSLKGKLANLQKGDCIVAFTVLGIHALRREVEKKTGRKCAIVYGSLPPETRAQQARLFNDPDNDYDFLVASDAIGMGLNLAIKRIIFESTIKNNGVTYVPLQVSEVKQIAGRAGRYKTAHQAVSDDSPKSIADVAVDPAIGLDDAPEPKAPEQQIVGWVTTLDQIDHEYLKSSMKREPEPIKTAGLFPPSLIVERFANYFPPGTPFSYIMLRLHEISEIHPRFHLCGLKDQLAIADCIHTVKNLGVQDRIMICAAPINMRDHGEREFLRSLAECIADGKSGNLLDLEKLPLSVMDKEPSGDRAYLYSLEQLHKMLVCYLWLSYRFPNHFTTRSLANYTKKLVEDQIEKTLTEFSHTELARARMRFQRNKAREEMGDEERESLPGKEFLNDRNAFVEKTTARDDEDGYPEDPLPSYFVEERKAADAPRSSM